jgi:hypothetical protein
MCALAIALALGGAAAAGGQTVVDPLQAAGDGGEIVLVAAGAGARLTFPDGHRLALDLPPGGELTALAAASDGWLAAGSLAAADGHRRLLLLAGDRGRARRLPAPPRQTGRMRRDPVPLVDGGRLAGLAWLEGEDDRALGVAAAMVGADGAWRSPEWVSRPGAGSQLALTGAVLADGSWLLAWSAVDGRDDEIAWSRREGEGGWLPPGRASADNDVPDITPALAAAGEGALLAWSRYDGNDYRLMLARFADGAWRDERVAGGAATLYPAFAGDRERPVLTYRSAVAGTWVAEELDVHGRARRRAEVASARADRPVVAPVAGLGLTWPGGGDPPAEER